MQEDDAAARCALLGQISIGEETKGLSHELAAMQLVVSLELKKSHLVNAIR